MKRIQQKFNTLLIGTLNIFNLCTNNQQNNRLNINWRLRSNLM